MLQELRLYTVPPGRLGDHHVRHNGKLATICQSHGIDIVGRWSALVGQGTPMFAYMMRYSGFAEREAQWDSFYRDQAWWKYREETNAGFEMVDRVDLHFLKPNIAWQPSPAEREAPLGGTHELQFVEVSVGRTSEAADFLAQVLLPAVERHGGTIMMVSDFVSGVCLPRVALMIAWPDIQAHYQSRRAVDDDVRVKAAQSEERQRMGRTSLGRVDAYLLEPAAYNLPRSRLGRTD